MSQWEEILRKLNLKIYSMNEPKQNSFLTNFLIYVLPPIAVLGLSVFAVSMLVVFKKEPAEQPLARIVPTVEYIVAQSEDVTLDVLSQGTVTARTNTLLFSEVSGIVEEISPALLDGGFFEKGDLLVKIEDTEYRAAVANARSTLAQTELLYEQEKALAEQAVIDWEQIGDGEPTPLVLREPQLNKAMADVEAAQMALQWAERNLERTQIYAPYDGRVQQKFIDLGQSVAAKQSQIASIYSVDFAEVVLPIRLSEAAFIELPEAYLNGAISDKPKVMLTADLGSNQFSWEGYIDRTGGTLDAQTRQILAVATVKDPYAKTETLDKPPLKVGMFVNARIVGRPVNSVFVLPRRALRNESEVYIVNDENRLELRTIERIKQDVETVIVRGDLESGERIVLTPLEIVVEGMELNPES